MTRRNTTYLLAALVPFTVALAANAFESSHFVTADSSLAALFAMMLPVAVCAYVGGVRPGLIAMASAVAASIIVLHPVMDASYMHWLAALTATPLVGGLVEQTRMRMATQPAETVAVSVTVAQTREHAAELTQEVVARARRESMAIPMNVTAN